MAVVSYSNIPIFSTSSPSHAYYGVAATNLTITTQNQLEPSRILAANQNNNFRIGGELNTKISMTFPAINYVDGGGGTWNFASGVLKDLTGNTPVTFSIAELIAQFTDCYLESVSVDIVPFAPVMVTAEFTCLNPPINYQISGTDPSWDSTYDLASGIAYGYTTTITSGATLSDANRESINYKINYNRSYTTTLGGIIPDNVFLNSIEKEVSIKATNIYRFIDYTGYGEIININPKSLDGQNILDGGFGLSSNCRIVAQNLSVQEGGILAGDISLKEVIL